MTTDRESDVSDMKKVGNGNMEADKGNTVTRRHREQILTTIAAAMIALNVAKLQEFREVFPIIDLLVSTSYFASLLLIFTGIALIYLFTRVLVHVIPSNIDISSRRVNGDFRQKYHTIQEIVLPAFLAAIAGLISALILSLFNSLIAPLLQSYILAINNNIPPLTDTVNYLVLPIVSGVFLLTILTRGEYITGKEYIERRQEQAYDDYRTIINLLEEVHVQDYEDWREVRNRISRILQQDKEIIEVETSELRGIYSIVKLSALAASLYLRKGLSSDDREALIKTLRILNTRRYKRLEMMDLGEEDIQEVYEDDLNFLKNVIDVFEESLSLEDK